MNVLIDNDNVVIAKGTIEDLGSGAFNANGAIFGSNLGLTLISTTIQNATPIWLY